MKLQYNVPLAGYTSLRAGGVAQTLLEKEQEDSLAQCVENSQKPIWILGRKKPVVYGFTQVSSEPPTFALKVKDATTIQYAYLRYLENRLREQYGFEGTSIRIHTEPRATG